MNSKVPNHPAIKEKVRIMGRDMREIVREHKEEKVKLSAQHRDVFQQKLNI